MRPATGRVVCVDAFGPLNLQPRKGKCWRPVTHPHRQRATYHRYGGVMYMLAALDLASGRIVLPNPAAYAFPVSSGACSKCCGSGGPGRSCTSFSTTSPRTGPRQ